MKDNVITLDEYQPMELVSILTLYKHPTGKYILVPEEIEEEFGKEHLTGDLQENKEIFKQILLKGLEEYDTI